MCGNLLEQRRWVMNHAFLVVCAVIWVGVVSGMLLPLGHGVHLLYWNLLLGQVFLNLGSGNFKFHDELSQQGSAIKYAE